MFGTSNNCALDVYPIRLAVAIVRFSAHLRNFTYFHQRFADFKLGCTWQKHPQSNPCGQTQNNKKTRSSALRVFLVHIRKIYLSSQVAPVSSILALRASASAVGSASLTVAGALSTRAFASLRPRPVASRTALIT